MQLPVFLLALQLELELELGPRRGAGLGRQARSAPLLLCAWLTTVSKAAWQIN